MAVFAGVAAGAFALYALLAPRVSGMGDSSEFTLVLATNGVAHPTGYPLYTVIGHLFGGFLHAVGAPWPYAANLWSAAGGAVAIFLLQILAWRLIPGDRRIGAGPRTAAALLPALLLLLNPIWAGEATQAEIGSWHIAWTLGAALFFLSAVRESFAPEIPPASLRARAALWGGLVGIGLAHHLTSVLVSGPLSIFLVIGLARNRRWTYPLAAWALAGALVPLSSYAVIFWHAWHPAKIQWPPLEPSISSVLRHITGDQYRHFLGYFRPAAPDRYLLAHAAYPFLFPGLVLLFVLAWRARTGAFRLAMWGLLAGAALVTAHAFSYGVPDPASYFIPAVVIGLAGVAPFVALFLALPAIPVLARRVVAGAGAAGVALLLFVWFRDAADTRADIASYERITRAMWSSITPEKAIVFWPDDRYVRLVEYQLFRGEKPGIYVTNPDDLMNDFARAKFRTRFGFDPLEGLIVPHLRPGQPDEDQITQRFLVSVVRNVTARADLPVILFDPSVPVVKLLAKQ